jgi:AraC-like DNA-binding protein
MEVLIRTMKDPRSRTQLLQVRGLPQLLDLGLVRDVPGHPRRHLDFWVFGMVLEGTAGVQVGSSQLLLQPGEYYILPAHALHFGLDEASFDVAFFHFTLPAIGPALLGPTIGIDICGKLPKSIDYLAWFRFIEKHFRRHRTAPDEIGLQLSAVMQQIALTQGHRSDTATAKSQHLGGAVLDLLQFHYPEDLSADEVSHRLGYSYSHLERAFRREYGISIHQQLLRVRVDAAAHGLQMGKSIKEVAAESGFRDYYYFLKTFKRLRGVTPRTLQETTYSRTTATPLAGTTSREVAAGA